MSVIHVKCANHPSWTEKNKNKTTANLSRYLHFSPFIIYLYQSHCHEVVMILGADNCNIKMLKRKKKKFTAVFSADSDSAAAAN